MEKKPPPRRARDTPSFSSSLLDAIYRSLDDQPDAPRDTLTRGAPHRASSPRYQTSYSSGNHFLTVTQPRPYRILTSSSSSSDGSSSAGFSSSSEPELGPVRLRPIRTGETAPGPVKPRPQPLITEKKTKPGSVKSRPRDPRRPQPPAASPGARIAGFLSSIFAHGPDRKHKKPSPAAGDGPGNSSPAAAVSRSCLSAMPGGGGKRAGRFCNGVVVAGRRAARAAAEGKRGFGVAAEEEEEEEEVASDGSSDLFELEDLTVVGGGCYKDELPVYGTTNLGRNRAISRGIVL